MNNNTISTKYRNGIMTSGKHNVIASVHTGSGYLPVALVLWIILLGWHTKKQRNSSEHALINTEETSTQTYESLNKKFSDPQCLFQSIRNHINPANATSSISKCIVNGSEFQGDAILDGWAKYFESLSIPHTFTPAQLDIIHEYNSILLI